MSYTACVACSGRLAPPSAQDQVPSHLAGRVLVCVSCGGLHATELLSFEAGALVGVGQPMVAEAPAVEPIRYFDLEVLRPKAGRYDRVHGWFAPGLRRVVQYG